MTRACGHRWDIPLAEAALLLGSFGYRVLPLEAEAKRPHRMLGHEGGVYHATSQPGQLAWWWHLNRWANIGVATGEPSQLVVLDLDIKRADGPANFRQFLEQYGLAVPWDVLARTPSAGWHCWLRWLPQYGKCPDKTNILPGVDIKGSGGYVVAAPSYLVEPDSAGGDMQVPYAWYRDSCPCSVPVAPPWFVQWVTTAPSAGSAGTGGSGGDLDAEKVMTQGAPVGQRNEMLHKLACSRFRKYGTGPDGTAAVLADLRQAWAAGDTAGMSWREVRVIAWSARKFIEKQEAAEAHSMAGFLAYLDRSMP
jgi:Bifunctional DNA primase/polymerase, N-terminal